MKTSQLTSFLFALVLSGYLVSCSTGKVTETTSADSTEVSTESTDVAVAEETESSSTSSDEINLKGIYVTSIRMPHNQYDYHNLFDGNEETYWATMPGAGPAEGIMLYFDKGISISKLQLKQPTGESFSKIDQITVYVNGQPVLDNVTVGDAPLDLNQRDIYSLFIRFSHVADTYSAPFANTTLYMLKENMSVAISELELYGIDYRMKISPPKKVAGDIVASSTLEPAVSYGVRNLFDARKEFVWVEGAPGNGEKQTIKFSFESPQQISGLTIMNGFQRSEKHFSANARVKTLTIENENGEKEDLKIADEDGEQSIKLSKTFSGKQFTMTVKDAYPGTSYKDLVISELKFENPQGQFIVEDNITEKLKSELLAKIKGTILDGVIDRNIYNEDYTETYNAMTSIVLRSDYTFVAYIEKSQETDNGEETSELIADGNWELKSVNGDEAKVRIFGKLTRISESTDYYAGGNSTSYIQIFQDNLTVTKDNIVGEKYIESIVRGEVNYGGDE